MATNQIYKFRDIDQAALFLNGAVIGASLRGMSAGTIGIAGLVGMKLKFSQPASAEVTFVAGSGPNPQVLTLADIKSQIQTAVAGTLVRTFDGELVIVESTPTNGVHIIPASTPSLDARKLLGFDGDHDTIGLVYKPANVSNTPPCWTWADTNNENMHVIYVWA